MDFIRVGKQRNSSVQLAGYKRRAVVVVMGPSHGRVLCYSLRHGLGSTFGPHIRRCGCRRGIAAVWYGMA